MSEAIELAADAIQAGIFYDLGSGSNFNIFAVGRFKCDKLYNYRVFNKKEFNDQHFLILNMSQLQLMKKPILSGKILSLIMKVFKSLGKSN